MGMTHEEAATILNLSVTASKAEVNSAYRALVARYHPDANRNKSEQERKNAEVMFKQVAAARAIMLDPSKAEQPKPEPQPQQTQQSQPRAQQNTYAQAPQQPYTPPRPTYTPRVNVDPRTNATVRTRPQQSTPYNTATTFHDNTPRIPDDAERLMSNHYTEEAHDKFKANSDFVRATPSLIVSAIALIVSIFFIVTDPSGFAAIRLSNPFILIALAAVAKILVYDLFISYYLRKAFMKAGLGWLFVNGIECVLIGAGIYAISNSIPDVELVAIASIVAGVGLAIGSFIKKMMKK